MPTCLECDGHLFVLFLIISIFRPKYNNNFHAALVFRSLASVSSHFLLPWELFKPNNNYRQHWRFLHICQHLPLTFCSDVLEIWTTKTNANPTLAPSHAFPVIFHCQLLAILAARNGLPCQCHASCCSAFERPEIWLRLDGSRRKKRLDRMCLR